MKKLSDTCQRLGYMFGLHDQYRDFYFDAPSFSKDEALMLEDGSIFEIAVGLAVVKAIYVQAWL